MNAYHAITTEIKNILLAEEDVNTVIPATELDLNKKDIFPVCTIQVVGARPTDNAIQLEVWVEALNIRNHSNQPVTDKWERNHNMHENLNDMLYVLIRLYLQLLKQKNEEGYTVELASDFEAIYFKGTTSHDGWIGRFIVTSPLENVTSC